MPADRLLRRFDKSNAEQGGRPQFVNRQGEVPPPSLPFPRPPWPGPPPFAPPRPPPGLPQNHFIPGSQMPDDGGEDNSDGEDGDDRPNPFESVTSTASQTQEPLLSFTTTTDNPFTPMSATSGFVGPTPILPSSSNPMVTGTSISTELSATYLPPPTLLSTSATPFVVHPTSSTVSAALGSTSTDATITAPNVSSHPLAKAAIVVPSVLGAVSAIAAAYLLFRYCTPLRARWAIYRARRGQRIPEEEDGAAPTTASQMAEAHATRTAEASLHTPSRPSTPSTPMTSALSFTQGAAVALPITTTRAPLPILVHNASRNNPPMEQPMLQGPPSRSNSGKAEPDTRRSLRISTVVPPVYASGGYGTSAFKFNFAEHTASRVSDGQTSHPSGLANNPPTPVAGRSPATSDTDEATSPVPMIPSRNLDSGAGVRFSMPPSTPSAARFPAPSPPGSAVNSPQRCRKSITPSESVSNAPDSPFPLTPGLMPPMPLLNSRWSHNSSSVNGRITAEAMDIRQSQSGDRATVGGRPISRFPSLQSSSSPFRVVSKQL